MVRNDVPWDQTFSNLTNPTISPDGSKTSAAVQVVEFAEGEIHKFQEGTYTAAVDGNSWDCKFVNVWKTALSPDGQKVAAEVRLNLYDYTIAVDGRPWEQIYDCVWEPIFHPAENSVVAPVRIDGKWTVARRWRRALAPALRAAYGTSRYSPDGSKLAAIVAPKFGRWTVAVDGKPWPVTFKDMVVDLVSARTAAALPHLPKTMANGAVCADGRKWRHHFSMVWKPVFCPQRQTCRVKVEINGKYSIAVDDTVWGEEFDTVWDPVFSPDGDRVLVRAVRDGKYVRHVIALRDITN